MSAGRPGRRAAIAGGALALLLSSVGTGVAADPGASGPGTDPAPASSGPASVDRVDPAYGRLPAPDFEMVLSNDFLNNDVGDTRRSPLHGPGDPTSTNARFERSLSTVLDSFASEFGPGTSPRYVAVAGDLVQGHWGMDTAGTGIFGPVDTDAQRLKAVRRAGRLYYTQWMERFAEHGLQPLPGIGDHELGDNPWAGASPRRADYVRFKQQTIPFWKRTFGDFTQRRPDGSFTHPDRPPGQARHSAYATRLSPEVQFVSLDAFIQTGRDVITKVDKDQLAWLQGVLEDARADGVSWVVVQLHPYIAGPVRQRGSSSLRYRAGIGSRLWRLMDQYGVDLVSAGEVHAVTATQPEPGGPVQIANGGVFAPGWTSYLDLEFVGDTLSITAKAFSVAVDRRDRLWQTDEQRAAATPTYGEAHVTGTLVMTTDGIVLQRTGNLGAYAG